MWLFTFALRYIWPYHCLHSQKTIRSFQLFSNTSRTSLWSALYLTPMTSPRDQDVILFHSCSLECTFWNSFPRLLSHNISPVDDCHSFLNSCALAPDSYFLHSSQSDPFKTLIWSCYTLAESTVMTFHHFSIRSKPFTWSGPSLPLIYSHSSLSLWAWDCLTYFPARVPLSEMFFPRSLLLQLFPIYTQLLLLQRGPPWIPSLK